MSLRLEIEEKINKIKWCQTANGALFLLSTNDKTIKFWKGSYLPMPYINKLMNDDDGSGRRVKVYRWCY
ncbi:hypothetical protein HN51_027261 [Arachis hypogaea]